MVERRGTRVDAAIEPRLARALFRPENRLVQGFVAPTDQPWFDFLAARNPDEVNFWTPSGRGFGAISAGEPFFFKLKAPRNAIAGFGIFTRAEVLPLWLAWETFGEANGAASQDALVSRIRANRADAHAVSPVSQIGCRLITDAVFLPEDRWVAAPSDWGRSIMTGKRYALDAGEGNRIWRECLERADGLGQRPTWIPDAAERARFGRPTLIRPRLGQGGFRLAVFDAYDQACCVTREHSLPVLDAAHIRPYASGGEHRVSNGLPLRRDIHRLFDLGYVTVRPDLTFIVSDRLRVDYHNGRTYYALQGQRVRVPERMDLRPSPEALEWHSAEVFRAS